MTRMKMGFVAACAAALCLCALSATNAAAAGTGTQWEECLHEAPTHTTTQYADSTCTGTGTGGYYWSPIKEIGRIKDTSVATTALMMTFGGINFEIQCSGESGEGKAESAEVEGEGVIRVSELAVSYEGCSVTKPAGGACTVPSTITTNSLKSETVLGSMQVQYAPTSGSTFVTFTVGGASCAAALKGTKTLTGTAASVYEEAEGIEEFTETSGSALKFAGQNAKLTGKRKWCTAATGTRGRYATS